MRLPDVLPATHILVALCRLVDVGSFGLFFLRLRPQRTGAKVWSFVDHAWLAFTPGVRVVSGGGGSADSAARFQHERTLRKDDDRYGRRQTHDHRIQLHWTRPCVRDSWFDPGSFTG